MVWACMTAQIQPNVAKLIGQPLMALQRIMTKNLLQKHLKSFLSQRNWKFFNVLSCTEVNLCKTFQLLFQLC